MIPVFKNTQEALLYGLSIKDNEKAIRELLSYRAKLCNDVRALLSKGKEAEALFLASGQAQFAREALQEAIK